jgi:phage baseplate assembly protein W
MRNDDSVGWSFPVRVNPMTGKIETTTMQDDVKQSILILLRTFQGERLYHGAYGSNVNKFMFEPVKKSLMKNLKVEVLKTIRRWEKRAENLSIDVYNIVDNETALVINIRYTIAGTDIDQELNYALDLLENEEKM